MPRFVPTINEKTRQKRTLGLHGFWEKKTTASKIKYNFDTGTNVRNLSAADLTALQSAIYNNFAPGEALSAWRRLNNTEIARLINLNGLDNQIREFSTHTGTVANPEEWNLVGYSHALGDGMQKLRLARNQLNAFFLRYSQLQNTRPNTHDLETLDNVLRDLHILCFDDLAPFFPVENATLETLRASVKALQTATSKFRNPAFTLTSVAQEFSEQLMNLNTLFLEDKENSIGTYVNYLNQHIDNAKEQKTEKSLAELYDMLLDIHHREGKAVHADNYHLELQIPNREGIEDRNDYWVLNFHINNKDNDIRNFPPPIQQKLTNDFRSMIIGYVQHLDIHNALTIMNEKSADKYNYTMPAGNHRDEDVASDLLFNMTPDDARSTFSMQR